ncbi:hypothetical protein SAMN04515659_0620 [Dyella sp. 333MFSha]|nr:hypothetical protein SAMN04515659_0620 [Dyella sp. 333MFSha]
MVDAFSYTLAVQLRRDGMSGGRGRNDIARYTRLLSLSALLPGSGCTLELAPKPEQGSPRRVPRLRDVLKTAKEKRRESRDSRLFL